MSTSILSKRLKACYIGLAVLSTVTAICLFAFYCFSKERKRQRVRFADLERQRITATVERNKAFSDVSRLKNEKQKLERLKTQHESEKQKLRDEHENERLVFTQQLLLAEQKISELLDKAILSNTHRARLQEHFDEALEIHSRLEKAHRELLMRLASGDIPERFRSAQEELQHIEKEKSMVLEDVRIELEEGYKALAAQRKELLTCSICYEVMQDPVSLITVGSEDENRVRSGDVKVTQLLANKGCMHSFCGTCAQSCIRAKASCPTCRRPVVGVNHSSLLALLVENFIKEFPEVEYEQREDRQHRPGTVFTINGNN